MSNRAGYLASQSKNKYHAIRHGIYASRKEARRAEELKAAGKGWRDKQFANAGDFRASAKAGRC